MSMRTIARSSSKRKSASDLASSVLPMPVGPRNRNEPVGRFGSEMPARERRTASLTARDRVALADQPLADDRPPSRAAWRSRPASSRPVGMPVQASTTSAICSAPTSSPTSGSSVGLLGRPRRSRSASPARGSGRRGSRWPPSRLPSRSSLSASIRSWSSWRRSSPSPSSDVLLALPAGLEPAQLLLLVGEVGAQRRPAARSRRRRSPSRARTPPSSAGRPAAGAGRSPRATTRSPSAAGTRPRRSGRSPCRAAGGR